MRMLVSTYLYDVLLQVELHVVHADRFSSLISIM